jgi:precorrin-2 dehydrogenase/sirohydrochlorin ferrochelatase
MLLTASTGGKSPGLARRLKTSLEGHYPAEWEARLTELSTRREEWRAQGADFKALIERTNDVIDEKGWLA